MFECLRFERWKERRRVTNFSHKSTMKSGDVFPKLELGHHTLMRIEQIQYGFQWMDMEIVPTKLCSFVLYQAKSWCCHHCQCLPVFILLTFCWQSFFTCCFACLMRYRWNKNSWPRRLHVVHLQLVGARAKFRSRGTSSSDIPGSELEKIWCLMFPLLMIPIIIP